MSSEQQELLDLLRNEVAELVGTDFSPLDHSDYAARTDLLEDFEIQTENLSNAARLVGLVGLANACNQLAKNFQVLAADPSDLPPERQSLVRSWPVMLLAYLQYFGQGETEQKSISELVDFLSDEAWPFCLSSTEAEQLREVFGASGVVLEENTQAYPEQVDAEMTSLAIADDVRHELIQGLLTELPGQVDAFERAVEQYLITEDQMQLRIAQRIAHTVKGAANVVGVAGMANLMHYVEDLLEKGVVAHHDVNLSYLLQDAADCLSAMSEYLVGIAPPPDNTVQVLQDVLAALRELKNSPPQVEDWPKEQIAFSASRDYVADAQNGLRPVIAKAEPVSETASGAEIISFQTALEEAHPVVAEPYEPPAAAVSSLSATELTEQSEADIPLLDDIYHRPNQKHQLDRDSKDARSTSSASITAHQGPPPSSPLTPVSVIPETLPAQVGSEDEIQQNLTVSEMQAQELLRLSGESQIGTAQLLTRIGAVSAGVQAAEAYHHQLRAMAAELERLIELQTALTSASGNIGDEDIDPLELERYNELNSFASQLHEITTDAFEAIAHVSGDLKELKTAVLSQRQLGFETQQLLMRIRMIPVSLLTPRFTRCVRQAARLTRKPARLEIKGEHTLIDTRVLNALVDPIMHLVRNAVDHGLEGSEAERLAVGKPGTGTVTLEFSRMGETVQVKCIDDGRGLDYAAIAHTAYRRGIWTEIEKPSPAQLHEVILAPGFSTRDQVTQTSGRGVGLDIVNDQVRQLKGNLSISSQAGRGTCFTVSAPMSILSAHTLVVQSGRMSISIVSRALEQVIYLEPGSLISDGHKMRYRLPGEEHPIPVFALSDIAVVASEHHTGQYGAIIVTRNRAGQLCGVLVEHIRASEEQIIKPLSRYTVKVPGVVGATVLGDGSVSPVLDLHELPALNMSDRKLLQWQERFQRRLTDLRQAEPLERPVALVVDDSLSARRSLAQFVGDMGMEVYTAKDGFEAIQIINQRKPSIILADLEMPRMNGLELTSHLRANQSTRDIPIIMITSRSTEKHRGLAERVGVSAYLNKPWTDEELLSSIQKQIA